MSPQAKITYLFHSGYAVETAHFLFIFDYYQPAADLPATLENGFITGEWLRDRSNVYVFASHRHSDHFDPAILEWSAANPEINYIFSRDIRKKPASPKFHSLSAAQEFSAPGITVRAFGSTDVGVSFWLQADGLNLFHAGDLNWWHWKEETPQEQATAEKAFKAEIAKLEGRDIDIAFFPVDRRLEEYYADGAIYFATKLQPRLLLPMHFGHDYPATQDFAVKAKTLDIPTVAITRRGQVIMF
ncbi:L-ascorbate metabolism protein UlaG (beta-lactamase superfamily) [Hydrogenispora ethanolica]|jgi:L-ascorbate metabolism protein UlaG (beta-lactamase superfamily)|uniref:L-ascorbate metabolism protein UlaG (Beta-lactamase superfamily) n=1 Tax=Hydrogenispora ethanolica TaxID=1082276 RepID=A0A4R1RIS3_HYDET|nr:MBL fold metallo-hydrolase [Hydrogenispora ethanolica]TCL65886.1 L-ascorbate metabolism protein UlaG (beta-lactamase superfamily) [Hydrogenispora ethanolica]